MLLKHISLGLFITFKLCIASPCEEQVEKIAHLREALDREASANGYSCFESHYELIDYGCDESDRNSLLRGDRDDGRSHIGSAIKYSHIHPIKSEAQNKLQQAISASVGICALEEQYQSTNFQGIITCMKPKCKPTRLTHKSAMTGGVSVESKEIEAGRDARKGIGYDEVYSLK